MDMFVQLISSGFLVGGIYALIALGFVLIYKATNIINFATGEFMMIGAYIFYSLMVYLELSVFIGFPLVVVCAALLGMLVERLIRAYFAALESSQFLSSIRVPTVLRIRGRYRDRLSEVLSLLYAPSRMSLAYRS